MHLQRTIQLAVVILVAVVTVGCGRLTPKTWNDTAGAAPWMTYSGPRSEMPATPVMVATFALAQRRADEQLVINTVRWMAAAQRREPPAHASVAAVPAPAVNVGDTATIAACIKSYESGNYAENSHPSSGSGAYQFIPSTWQTWSARAGYPGYTYAYQAPSEVQDAVIEYALTHGGAGNWSNRFGNDPCTAGLPGGG